MESARLRSPGTRLAHFVFALHVLAAIQAVNIAKNDLVEQLRQAETDRWPELVAAFMNRIRRSPACDPQVSLTVVLDLVDQVSRMLGDEPGCDPAEVFLQIADEEKEEDVGPDASRMFRRLERSLRDWLVRVTPLNGSTRIAYFINGHLHEPMTSKSLAKRFGYSQRCLSELFKKHTGLTVPQYVASQRMRRAEELIRQGEKVEVAMLEVGYRNKTHFYRAFKKQTGRRPGECAFRKVNELSERIAP